MFTSNTPLLWVQRFGTWVLLLLAVLASTLYIERGTFMDVAFQTFELIRTKALAPQVFRFGSGMTQIFPLIAIWCHASLRTVVFMYSLGVIIYQSALFFYIAFIRKNAPIALAFITYICLSSSHSFFWIQSEFSQSIPFGFACLAFLQGKTLQSLTWYHSVIGIVLLTTGVFFHPLQGPLLLVFFFLLFFSESNKKIIVVSSITVIIIAIVKQVFFSNWYDNMAAERLKTFNIQPSMLINRIMFLIQTGWGNYLVLLLAILIIIWLSWQRKEWLYVVFVPLFSICYFLFILATHPEAEAFYIDNLLLAIPAILAYVLAVLFIKKSEPHLSLLQQGLAWLVLLFFIVRVVLVSSYYKQRIHTYNQLIQQYSQQKIMLPAATLPRPMLLFAWPTAYEVWMHSTLEHGATASLLFIDDTTKYNQTYSPTKQFRGVRNYPYDSLLPPYFIWKDTLSSYQLK